MKNLLALVLMASITIYANAQIKVFTGGNVSIGSTVAPPSNFKLQLIGNSVFSANTGSITSSAYIRGLNSWSTATNPDYTWLSNDTAGIFHPDANIIGFSTSGTERMRVVSNGLLIPSGNSYWIGNNCDTGDRFRFHLRNSDAYIDYAKGSLHFRSGTTDVVTFDKNGNVAIGASIITGIKFYAYGGLHCFSNYNSTNTFSPTINFELWALDPRIYSPTNNVVFYNTPITNDWIDIEVRNCFQMSDRNRKKNITSISNGLTKVLQLQGVTFNWINDSLHSKLNAGFIAQDVEQIIPEAVKKIDSTQMRLLNYSAIIPYIVEAIKEQYLQITQLQSDVLDCCSKTTEKEKGKSKNNKGNDVQNNTQNDTNNVNFPVLYQNIPNPFSTMTEIKYYLPPRITNASIMIFDMQGSLIKTYQSLNNGKRSIIIYGGELKPGMYMYSLIANGKEIDTKKMILTD